MRGRDGDISIHETHKKPPQSVVRLTKGLIKMRKEGREGGSNSADQHDWVLCDLGGGGRHSVARGGMASSVIVNYLSVWI